MWECGAPNTKFNRNLPIMEFSPEYFSLCLSFLLSFFQREARLGLIKYIWVCFTHMNAK